MTTSKDFDDVFAEGEQAKTENPAQALREERLKNESAATTEFTAAFETEETTATEAATDDAAEQAAASETEKK